MAGIIQAPNIYAPVSGWEQTGKRQKLVLERMAELDLITREELDIMVQEYYTLRGWDEEGVPPGEMQV